MKPRGALGVAPVLMSLAISVANAATAYVTDELVLGVYTEQNGGGSRLATLHSGATLETLTVSGEFTQVRLGDGTVGWVKSTYLTNREPAAARLKELEDELESNLATTPELAETAARSEVDSLKRALAAKQSELDAARAAPPASVRRFAPVIAAAVVCSAAGYWLGHSILARRIRRKFGGIKVY